MTLAAACLFLMDEVSQPGFLNAGSGSDLSIAELAALVGDAVGFEGRFVYDVTKPDGTPQKVMDVSRLTALGWRARIALAEGVEHTYRWYLQHAAVRDHATS